MAKTTQSVEVGAVYRASVNGKKIDMRVEREIWKGEKHTGWGGINLATNRPTTIKAGTKMTRVEEPAPAPAPGDAPTPNAAPSEPGVLPGGDVGPTGGKKSKAPMIPAKAKAATGGTGGNVAKTRAPKAAKPKAPRRPSLLDLAADVLAKSKAPMTCGAIVEAVLAEKLWTTTGKTPAATLYSAVVREISAKGKESRFAKTDRGLFKANAKAE